MLGLSDTVYPPPWLGKEGARYGESNLVVAPVSTHAPKQGKEANTSLKK